MTQFTKIGAQNSSCYTLILAIYEWILVMSLSLIATLISQVSMGLLVSLMLQMRGQKRAT